MRTPSKSMPHNSYERNIKPRSSRRWMAPATAPPLTQRLRIHCLLPTERTFFGIHQRGAQPAMTLPDGSTLSLY